MIVYILYLLAYRRKKVYLLFPAFVLVSVRNTFRMCDIEDTASYISNAKFIIMMLRQSNMTMIFFFCGNITFHRIRYPYFFYFAYMVIYTVSLAMGSLKFKNENNEYLNHEEWMSILPDIFFPFLGFLAGILIVIRNRKSIELLWQKLNDKIENSH